MRVLNNQIFNIAFVRKSSRIKFCYGKFFTAHASPKKTFFFVSLPFLDFFFGVKGREIMFPLPHSLIENYFSENVYKDTKHTNRFLVVSGKQGENLDLLFNNVTKTKNFLEGSPQKIRQHVKKVLYLLIENLFFLKTFTGFQTHQIFACVFLTVQVVHAKVHKSFIQQISPNHATLKI